MKRGLTLLLMMCLVIAAHTQPNSAKSGKQPSLPSWQTYEFMKYGNIGASLYTGTINYSIPIFTYKDGEFDYTMSIDYATNGLRVNHKSGILGHSWILRSPGIITREIHGIPDNINKEITIVSGSTTTLRGYNSLPADYYSYSALCDQNNRHYTCLVNEDYEYYDAEPDIYSFNFCGFSGKFRRFPNAKGYLMFDLSSESKGLIIKDFSNSRFVFVDGNGYEYTFDVDESSMEPSDNSYSALTYELIRSWSLSGIKAPSGRKITFVYHEYKNNQNNEEKDITYTSTLTYDFASYNGFYPPSNSSSSDMSIHDYSIDHHKLRSILFPDKTKLTFSYEEGQQEYRYLSPGGDISEAHGFHKRLNSITATHDNEIVRKAKFTYEVKEDGNATGNKLTFLKSVNISGLGAFSFDYYDMHGYPALGSIQSDHWGYYNGANGGFPTTYFWTHVTYDSCYNEHYSSSVRKEPNFEASLSGALKQISYPTGGYSRISYEPHDYSELVRRNSTSLFLPHLDTLGYNRQAGGIRLKQIITYLSDTIPNDTTSYDYSFANSNLSSGILINEPRYGIVYTTTGGKHVEHYNLTNHIYDHDNTHIEYSYVKEHKSGKGFNAYSFSTYRNHPDELLENDKENRQLLDNYWINAAGYYCPVSFTNPNPYVTNLLTPVASHQFKRGLLTGVSNFDSMGVLRKRKSYNYSFPLVYIDTVYKVVGEIAREVYYPRHNNKLDSIVETDSLANGKISKTTRYTYNSFGLPSIVSSTTSEGSTLIEKTMYSGDSISPYGIIKLMNDNNIINNVLQKETLLSSHGTMTLLNKTKYNYDQPNIDNPSLVRLSSIEKWHSQDGWKPDEAYLYDNLGLLKQKTDLKGVSTSYLWGYFGRYPLAIVENGTTSELEHGLQSAGISSSSALRDTTFIDDDSFCRLMNLNSRMPWAHVNIYKFKPNVGMTERIMGNSIKTFYDYDGLARLVTMADNNNKVTERNEYNLITVKPLAQTVSCPNSCHINDSVRIVSNAIGGMGDYQFSCIVKDDTNHILFQSSDESGVFEFSPHSINGFQSNRDYSVFCTVVDLTSNETCSSNHTLHINNAIIRFSDITEDYYDSYNGDMSVSATIYTDNPVEVEFGLSLMTSGTCDVKVNNSPVIFTGNSLKTGQAMLSAGNNIINIDLENSVSETMLTLVITNAGNHDIGNPHEIHIEF